MSEMKKYYREPDYIHYANCHEDADLLLKQVNPVARKRALSIASAGDNSFSLLTAFDRVVAVDVNPSQVFLCRLKAKGIERFSRTEFLSLIGVTPADSLALYRRLRPELDGETRDYFDNHPFLLQNGLIHSGKFEYYLRLFRRLIIKTVCSGATVEQFFSFDDVEKQKAFYDEKIDRFWWKQFFKVFFSDFVMSRLGRDKEYFRYNETPLSQKLKERVESGLAHTLNRDNPYLSYAMRNTFQPLPHYLRPGNYEHIRTKIHDIDFRVASFSDALRFGEEYDFMNLSDIFEYMSEGETSALESQILAALKPNSRVVFWNMINPRHFSDVRFHRIHEEERLTDRAVYYQDFFAYEVEE